MSLKGMVETYLKVRDNQGNSMIQAHIAHEGLALLGQHLLSLYERTQNMPVVEASELILKEFGL